MIVEADKQMKLYARTEKLIMQRIMLEADIQFHIQALSPYNASNTRQPTLLIT